MELDADNTAIVLDSTSDAAELVERHANWRLVPLYVRFGTETFRDYEEIRPDAFYTRLRAAAEPPTTSQPTPGDFLAAYEQLGAYERVYSLHVPGSLSGTLGSAETAAAETGGRVRAVDAATVSAGTAQLALALQRRLDRGTTDAEVDALLERFRRERGFLFTVDTLEFLMRGGRIGKARGWAGQLLNVKPVLTFGGTEIEPLTRARGSRKALAALADAFAERTEDAPGLRFALAHAEAAERAEDLAALLRARRPQAAHELTTDLGAVVGTHAGPGAVGLFWFADPD